MLNNQAQLSPANDHVIFTVLILARPSPTGSISKSCGGCLLSVSDYPTEGIPYDSFVFQLGQPNGTWFLNILSWAFGGLFKSLIFKSPLMESPFPNVGPDLKPGPACGLLLLGQNNCEKSWIHRVKSSKYPLKFLLITFQRRDGWGMSLYGSLGSTQLLQAGPIRPSQESDEIKDALHWKHQKDEQQIHSQPNNFLNRTHLTP